MANVFICYSRDDEQAVAQLAEDIRLMGHDAWFDQALSGGQAWWDEILSRIRSVDFVVVALSPGSLESAACKREYSYAAAVGKPILPVLVAEDVSFNLLPPALSAIQFVDYREGNREAVLRLARALTSMPEPRSLPDPLPPPPEVPVSYLGSLRERVEASGMLEMSEQSTLLVELARAIRDPGTRDNGIGLATKFRRRPELLATVAAEIDALLGEAGGAAVPQAAGSVGAAPVGAREGGPVEGGSARSGFRARWPGLPSGSAPLAIGGGALALVVLVWLVWPRPATQLAIVAPASAITGEHIAPFAVEFRRANGRVASRAEGQVTVRLTSDPTEWSAELWGTRVVDAVRGVATFEDLSIDTPGNGFNLTASAGGGLVADRVIDLSSRFRTGEITAGALREEDDEYELVPIGFPFPFYGTNYEEVWINTNGMIHFGEYGCDDYYQDSWDSPRPIPTYDGDDCDGFIAPFWGDLDVEDGGVYYGTSGAPPNRTFVVEWRGVEFWGESSSSLTFNVVLHEASGDVELQYDRMFVPGDLPLATGAESMIGFENEAGDRGLLVGLGTAGVITEGRVMRFALVDGNFVRVR